MGVNTEMHTLGRANLNGSEPDSNISAAADETV